MTEQLDLDKLERLGKCIAMRPDPLIRRGWDDMLAELRASRARIVELEGKWQKIIEPSKP